MKKIPEPYAIPHLAYQLSLLEAPLHETTGNEVLPFVAIPQSALQFNRTLNKMGVGDRPVHDWYRFVLSYPPHLVRTYLEKFGIDGTHTVLDPFCGTGTTVVECQKLGIASVGIEANGIAQFAGAVKTDWSVDPDGLIAHSHEIAAAVMATFNAIGIDDNPALYRWSHHDLTRISALRTLDPALEKLLISHSISPLPLHKVLVLCDHLQQKRDDRFYRHQLLALAKALTGSISNLRFGPEVGVGPPKADAMVVRAWLNGIHQMAHDLRLLGAGPHVSTVVHHADARHVGQLLAPHSIDAVITSPPYPNEKDYTRTTRLESVLLGFVSSKTELQALKRNLVRSNTRGVYISDTDDQWIADFPVIQHIADSIEARRIELGKTSGFERLYSRVTKLYFGGMARHLADLRGVLRPGAQLAYVVGDQASYLRVLIRTGHLLAEIAQSLGYEVVGIDLFRTRRATATNHELREEVVVLRWPGTAI